MTLPVATRPRFLTRDRLSPHGRPPARHRFPTVRRVGNGLRTAVLLAGLGGLLVLLGARFGHTGAIVGLLLGLATVAGSYGYSDRLALMAGGAVPTG